MGSVGRFGWGGAGFTYSFVDPEEELVAILMANVFPLGGADRAGKLRATFDTLVYRGRAD